MRPDEGTGVLPRSLDELASVAVRRGDHLRRRRRQLRSVPVAALAVVLVVGLLRLGADGSLTSVDVQPADRVEDDRAPAGTRTGDSGADTSTGSDVEAGAGPAAARPVVTPDADGTQPDEIVGRAEVGPPHVLYVSGAPGSGQPALWQFDRQSGAHLRRDDADLCRPAASRTGTIAYCKEGAIVLRDADGTGDPRVLVSDATDPDFSPSGERLAYVGRSTGRSVIWTVGVDGSNPRAVTDGTYDDRFPTWSPDGSQLAFIRASSVSRSVWIVGEDGSDPRKIADNIDRLDAHPLDWSPDGRQLAFTCAVTPSQSVRTFRPSLAAVCLLDLETGVARAVTPEHLQGTSPSWSPDGSTIAFTARPSSTTSTAEVWVMRADGTDERRLWPGGPGDEPAWFPVFLPARPSTNS